MLDNMHAEVKMEEGYMRLSIEYTKKESRSKICDAVEEIEHEMDMYPEVIHRRLTEETGKFSVEFSGEDYICQRTSGDFMERVLKKLNIDHCDV